MDITERKEFEQKIQLLNRHLERITAELSATNIQLSLRTREAERASGQKTRLLASVSHELRTPLNAISGFVDLLAEESAGPLTEKQKRYVANVRRGSQHLLSLLSDLSDLSRIEAGHFELNSEEVYVASAVAEVISVLVPMAEAKQIQLCHRIDNSTVLFVDAVRFRQVLYNLLSNAIKFTPDDGKVSVESGPERGGFLEFSVTDTGPGVPPGDQEAIFDEFFQGSTYGGPEGSGLGLAITKKLVEAHGGRIWVENREKGGSSFAFTFPIYEPAQAGKSQTVLNSSR